MSDLATLLDELAAVDLAYRAVPDAEADTHPLYDRHWNLREAINAIPARSIDDLRLKARAAHIARAISEGFNHVDSAGSYDALSLSLIADLTGLVTTGEAHG